VPTLYTSLIARRNPNLKTLAPKHQRSPIASSFEKANLEEHQAAVAEEHLAQRDTIEQLRSNAISVAVVGAGLAGLSAAYELSSRGYPVTVFEASNRVGGRTKNINHVVKQHHMDGGAELIGSNHPLWVHYADKFHLGFSDVREYDESPIVIGNRLLGSHQENKLLKEMNKAFGFISARAKRIVDPYTPWTDPEAAQLDQQNVHTFVMRAKWPQLCKNAVLQQLESDNGVAATDQSLLALLAMVRGGGMERYWVDTEVYRCKKGTQALSLILAAILKAWNLPVQLNSPVRAIDVRDDGVRITIGNDVESRRFDELILAIPPSTWSLIPNWSPVDLRTFVASPPQMGKNTKGLFAFDHRFWRAQGHDPNATLDSSVDQTWETTEQLHKPQFGLVAFSGAEHAAQLSEMDPVLRQSSMTSDLEQVYRNASKKVRDFDFMNWPKEPWALASYSFPRCGDILRCGPVFSEGFHGRLHFAGEHTCYAFTGYMEGALQSGYRLARKLVLRDRKAW